MLSVKFEGHSLAAAVERPVPIPRPGEVLLQVGASAICGSEMRSYRAAEARSDTPGHEFVGTVIENTNGCGPRVGDRVGIYNIVGCGQCADCRSGNRRLCKEQTTAGHAHAQYAAVPIQCCMPLPNDIPFDLGVLLCGDTIGVAFHALNRVRVHIRDTVAVVGVGPIGIGFLAMLRYLGVRSIAVEISPYRRALAEKLGASCVIDPSATDALSHIRELTSGRGVEVAVNASGRNAGLNLALQATRPQGAVIIASAGHETTLDPWDELLAKEIVVYCTYYFADPDYWDILDAYRSGLKIDDLVTHRFHLEEAAQAYDLFARGQAGKVVFVPKAEAGGKAEVA